MADWTVGTGYIYSDIVLRDRNGNPITHEDITRIDLDMADGRVQSYYDMGALRAYLLEGIESNSYFRVIQQLAIGFGGFYPENHSAFNIVTDAMIDEYGYKFGTDKKAVIILVTQKILVDGETYSYDYIMKTGGE